MQQQREEERRAREAPTTRLRDVNGGYVTTRYQVGYVCVMPQYTVSP